MLTMDRSRRDQWLVTIKAGQNGWSEFSVKAGKIGGDVREYSPICVEKLTPVEQTMIYAAAVRTLQDFRFTPDTHPNRLDGGFATIQLTVDKRSLKAGFSGLANTSELPASLREIVEFADQRLAKYPEVQAQ